MPHAAPPRVIPGLAPLPADLAATYVDPVAGPEKARAPGGSAAKSGTIALGETLAAPLPLVAPGSASQPRDGATTLSVLPRIELAGDELRLRPSGGEPRYRAVRTLGEGGMGEVALVEDLDIGRTVALKRLRAHDTQGHAWVARFVDEVRTTGSLEHPNIVPIHDVGVDEHGRYFFVMKYVDGETLESILEKLRAGDADTVRDYGVPRRLEIFVGLLRALQYAHARGIVHRDIKPANVMVGRYGEVVLMDWGVARPIGKAAAHVDRGVSATEMRAAPSRASQTHDGALIGTPLYMSPEQASGHNDTLDARSDLYSACVVLHELLGLRHLHAAQSGSLGQLIQAITSDDEGPRAVGMFAAHPSNPHGVPPELSHFVRRGLSRDPAARWQSASEMVSELETMLEGRCRVQCPATFLKRSTREVGRFVDRAPRLAMVSLYLGGIGVLALLANAVRDLVT